MKITTLQEFYCLLDQCRDMKRVLTGKVLESSSDSKDTQLLHETLEALENLLKIDGGSQLFLDKERPITIDLSYEINELKKDIIFLEQGEELFYQHLQEIHSSFSKEIDAGLAALKDIQLHNFLSDRDGTVNNYCGRYLSSIQSVYNAVFLTRFIKKCKGASILLTSAPLDNIGIVELSLFPDNTVIYAGSKGREFFDLKGQRHHFPIETNKQKKLDELNKHLKILVNDPAYEKFSLIGSGLQFKFGQTTIARQDITSSVPNDESKDFLKHIADLVNVIDPDHTFFRIEDTGKDIEIILTVSDGNDELKDFDKGDGIQFIVESLKIDFANSPVLVAGDTASDLPMVKATQKLTDQTISVFVTKDQILANQVKELSSQSLVLSEPDILVAILNQL